MTMHYLIPCGGKNSFLPWVTWKTTAMTITSRIKLHMSQTECCSIFGKKCTCTKSSNAAIFYYTSPTFCACLRIGRPRVGNTRCRSVHHTMSKCTPHDVEVYTNQMKGQRDTNCDSFSLSLSLTLSLSLSLSATRAHVHARMYACGHTSHPACTRARARTHTHTHTDARIHTNTHVMTSGLFIFCCLWCKTPATLFCL